MGEIVMNSIKLSRSQAELLLAGVIIARATSYLFSKLILQGMGMFNLLGLRFCFAFVVLTVLFFRRLQSANKKTIIAGIIMGGMYFLVVSSELSGLKRMASGNASFLVNTAIVLVPLLQAIIKRHFPQGIVILSVLLCFAGVGILTLGEGLGFGSGERWCLLAAFIYACTILVTDSLSHSGIDTLTAGVIQVGTIGALSLASSVLTESFRLPNGTMEWTGILMLAIVCTGFGFTLQPVAQSGTTADHAGMFCALNPLVAAGLGVLFFHEPFSGKTLTGGFLILSGILVAEWPEQRKRSIIQRSGAKITS